MLVANDTQVSRSRVRLWSRTGGEWTGQLPELDGLAAVGDVVVDGEVVMVTSTGVADFELVATLSTVAVRALPPSR
jgi:ATP-dependent DNA ligase